MDLEGFKVIRKSEWEQSVSEFHVEHEDNEYDSVNEALNTFRVTEISDDYAAVLHRLFPNSCSPGFGMFPLN